MTTETIAGTHIPAIKHSEEFGPHVAMRLRQMADWVDAGHWEPHLLKIDQGHCEYIGPDDLAKQSIPTGVRTITVRVVDPVHWKTFAQAIKGYRVLRVVNSSVPVDPDINDDGWDYMRVSEYEAPGADRIV